MESQILSQLGMNTIDPGIWVVLTLASWLFILILLIVDIVQGKKISKLRKRLEALCQGKNGESLEKELGKIIKDNEYLMNATSEHKSNIKNIYKRLEKTYQKMALIRYDAYHNMGGQLSFVVCMLDENDNGFLINSVHNSEGCYSFAKEIKQGSCDIELGTEEAKALEQAMKVKLPM